MALDAGFFGLHCLYMHLDVGTPSLGGLVVAAPAGATVRLHKLHSRLAGKVRPDFIFPEYIIMKR